MAAPTFTLINHQLLDDADDNTGWNDLVTPDGDIKVEGNFSMSGIFRATGDQGYYDHGSAPVTGAGKTVRGWIVTNNLAYMETEAAGGYQLIIYDGTTEELKTIFGSDTYPGGWFNYVWDMDDFTTVTLANVQRWGIEGGHASSAKNAINTWMDAIRYLDGYSMTGGGSGTEVELSDIATLDKVDAYNVVSVSPNAANVFFATGTVQFGNGATTHYFLSDGDVLTFKDLPIATGLYSLSGVGTGSRVVIKNGLFQASGATDTTRFVFDWSDTDLLSFTMTDHTIVRAALVTFKSGQTATGTVFTDCLQITHGGATMNESTVRGFEQTVGTAALLYDVAVDPNGEMDDMVFIMGTALTHAIELGSNTPVTISLSGHTYTGYNASTGSNLVAATGANDCAIFNDSGKEITINVIDGGNVPSVRNGTGATTIVVSSKTATFTPIDNGSAFTITRDSDNLLLEDVTSTTGGEVVYSYDGALDGTAATVHLIISGKEPVDFPWTVAEGTVPVSQVTDRVYSNP